MAEDSRQGDEQESVIELNHRPDSSIDFSEQRKGLDLYAEAPVEIYDPSPPSQASPESESSMQADNAPTAQPEDPGD